MKVYRLHNQLNLWEGPFTQAGINRHAWQFLRQHRGPRDYIKGLPDIWKKRIDLYTQTGECYFGWSTLAQMWFFCEDAKHWEFFFERMYVSELEVEEYAVLPDGQVMFMQKGTSVIKRYTTPHALRAAFEESR